MNLAAIGGFLRFALVGGSGVVVNLGVLALALRLGRSASVPAGRAVAETAATQAAILWNFALTEYWVFTGARPRLGRWSRLAGYWMVSMLALAVQLPLAGAFADLAGVGYVPATAAALGALVVGRYLVCRVVLYRRPSDATEAAAPAVGHSASLERVA